jgi:NTP pyrophosphatase (non-canonical NTP hydrolase)
MTFNEFQSWQQSVDKVKGDLWYPCLGLAGEVGEVTEHIKKYYRDGKKLDLEELALELGDVLHYVTMTASRLGIKLDSIAENNVKKINRRRGR